MNKLRMLFVGMVIIFGFKNADAPKNKPPKERYYKIEIPERLAQPLLVFIQDAQLKHAGEDNLSVRAYKEVLDSLQIPIYRQNQAFVEQDKRDSIANSKKVDSTHKK